MASERLFQILWIDDEHEELGATKGRALANGIKLHPFKSKGAGLNELKANTDFYDGVLLDARCFENEDDSKGTEDTQHSIDALQEIRELDKKFEIFVLTGQSEDQIDGSYKKMFKNVYQKGNNEHFVELIKRLKVSADSLIDTQIKYKYQPVFKLTDVGLFKSNTNSRIMNLAKYLEGEIKLDENELTPLRKVVENLFMYLRDICLIPNDIVIEKGWINKSSRFLAQIDDNYSYHDLLIPSLISENIHRLLNITQDGAHGSGTLTLNVDQYIAENSNNYLFKSAVYLLFDILSWFGENISIHQDKAVNLTKWEKKEGHGVEIKGTVTRITENGWGTFESVSGQTRCGIIPYMIRATGLSLNQEIVIVTKPDPNDPTGIHIDRIVRY